jgi:hypothetical protein
MNIHPSEKEIQQFSIDKSGCDTAAILHIETCEVCMAEVAHYQFLFTEISQQNKAAFDFDLSALVLPQLPIAKSRLSPDQFISGFLIFFISCFVGVPLVLFNKYILNMFSDISPFFIYAIIGSATVIVIYKTLGMYKKYQKQMQLLNFN